MPGVRVVQPYRVISGVGAGAGAALAMIIAMAGLRLGLNFPTLPELMLNPIVRLLGGEAFSAALDNLYYAGRPLLFTVILEGTLLLGVILGLLYARILRPDPVTGKRLPVISGQAGGIIYGLVIGVLLNTVFLPLIGQPAFATRTYGIYAESVIPLWAGMMLLGLIYGVTVHGLLPKVPVAPGIEAPVGTETPAVADPVIMGTSAVDRRSFLKITGGAVAALVGGVLFWYGGTVLTQGGFTSPVTNTTPGDSASTSAGSGDGVPLSGDAPTGTPEPTPTSQPTAEPLPTEQEPTPTSEPVQATEEATPTTGTAAQAEPPTTAPEPPTATVEPPTATPQPTAVPTEVIPVIKVKEIVPTESFYHVSKNFFDPSPSSNGWELEIKGMVNKPYSLTYAQLTALPSITVTTGMMCISNPVGGALIGNTTWRGVRLADLLKKAQPQSGAVDVVLRAVDDYSDSFPVRKAMDPDVMLVWEMGGKTLTSQHGYPARLLVPGIYGMKHVKWLKSIELVDYDYKGFWQDPSQGWSDPAPVNTMSRIDFPSDGNLSGKSQTLSGIAFAGNRSISKVEVSTDGGTTWNPAYVKPPASKTSWVVWGYVWRPKGPGNYKVMVRATDGKGNVQTARRADPYPNGATGYHTVTYKVSGTGGEAPSVSQPDQASELGIPTPGAKTVRWRQGGDPINN